MGRVGGVALAQTTLGITTLLMEVPIPLASAHQAGSVTLLTSALWFAHELRRHGFGGVIVAAKR